MDLDAQQRIKQLVENSPSPDRIVVLLGAPDAESAALFAETLTLGDPTWAGPLAGVSLKLPTYHVTEPAVRAAVDPQVYAEQIELMELALDTAAIHQAIRAVRERAGLAAGGG
jgi:glycine reductase